VGMEQLSSAAVAQRMLPPTTVGSSSASESVLSHDKLDKMAKPHMSTLPHTMR